MSKKDAYQDFLNDLMAAVPEDRRQAVEDALKADTVSSKLREGVLARSDYSRHMDALRAERESFQTEVAEARERIDGWTRWYESATQDYATMTDRLHALEAQGVDVNTYQPPTNTLTREQIEQELANRDRLAISFADVLTDLKLEHRERFKEKLDTQSLIGYATKRGLPIDAAYREFVSDKIEEQRQSEFQEQLAKAREEGARDYAAQHRLPISASPSEPHVLDTAAKVPANSRERVRAAASAWNSASHT